MPTTITNANANLSAINNFGKRWRITIVTLPSNGLQDNLVFESDTWTPEPLEIEFEVNQSVSPIGEIGGYWFAVISLYNLDQPTEQIVLRQGMTVKLEAGYQVGPGFGTIFEGTLYQPTWERLNGVDTKLTLHCIVGILENTNNFVSFNTAAGLVQKEIVSRMIQTPNIAYPLNGDNVVFQTPIKQTRGSVYFNQPGAYLAAMAAYDTSNVWITQQAINIRQLVDATEVDTLLVSQQTGLIGTPQQTQDGVEIRINLDARVLLRTQVQLSPGTNIKQLERIQGNFPTILDADGKYAVAVVRHLGNSRSDLWETVITGIAFIGSRLGLSAQ